MANQKPELENQNIVVVFAILPYLCIYI